MKKSPRLPPRALRAVMRYLSSLGAAAGGRARAASLSPERRSEISRLAGRAPKRPRKRALTSRK